MMSAAAHGQVPSAADMSMRQGMAQNQMAQMGAANMGRGNAGSAMAQRSSMMGGAGAQMQAIHAGGAARSGEIGDAQHAYGMGLSHARAGDNTLMNNSLAQAASMDAANRGWFGARQNINQAQLDANVYMENLAAGNLEQANALARSQKHDETAAALAAGEGAAAGATKLWSGSKDGSGDDENSARRTKHSRSRRRRPRPRPRPRCPRLLGRALPPPPLRLPSRRARSPRPRPRPRPPPRPRTAAA